MAEPKWERAVSRTEEVLHWDACVSIRRSRVRTGAISWGTESDLIIKNGPSLATWYADMSRENPMITNLGEFVDEVNPELGGALDDAIAIIERDLGAVPGSTRADARALYDRFRLDMGLMVFGLFAAKFPEDKLEASLGSERWEAVKLEVMTPIKRTLLVRENAAIAAAQERKDNEPESWIDEESARLAEEFGYIHSEYVSNSWTAADYAAAIRGPHLPAEHEKEPELSMFSPYEAWLVENLRKFVYILDEGKSALVRNNWALRETLKVLGENDRLLQLSEKEFYTWTESAGLPSDEEFEKRKLHYAIFSLDDRYEYFFGKDAVEALVKAQGITLLDVSNMTELKGSVASKGKVIGTVRVVETQEDSKALVNGEILVAAMTTPAYIDAMRRAAAYVTDEGGTICHAAIVAREFKKPCIVGTKFATKALKTGDTVEVDAEKGVVRIIQKA